MLCFPNAKINIGLHIVDRRPDQFHNIETVFYPIPLSDILEIIVDENAGKSKVNLRITGMSVPGEIETNLCTEAYQLVDSDFSLPSVKMMLHKIIPMGAGLGGGSSDGAHTLILLNKIFNLGLGTDELKSYADKLGSDCSFFIDNRPSLGVEKGNILSPVNVPLSGCYLVLVKPNVFVGTAEAYAGIKPHHRETLLNDVVKQPINHWKNRIVNDFETSIFDKHAEIKNVKEMLYRHGAVYASMTGSGSAVYGIFEKEMRLKADFSGMFYWAGWI